MRFLCISDTHGELPKLELDGVDYILHAGDIAPDFWLGDKENTYMDVSRQLKWFTEEFTHWAYSLGVPIILTSGNHDEFAQFLSDGPHDLAYGVRYCKRGHVEINRRRNEKHRTRDSYVKIYCFNMSKCHEDGHALGDDSVSDSELAKHFRPDSDVDIILAHSPPFGYRDFGLKKGWPLGSEHIYANIVNLSKLKYYVCGHIHEGFGVTRLPTGAKVVNCSQYDSTRAVDNFPILLEV